MATAVPAGPAILPRSGLLRVLGLGFTLALGIGAMIGGGILRTPGSVVAQVPLPWLALLLWALAGFHALLTANIVAEVMTSVPKSGGLFNVAERAFGNIGALLVGWADWLLTVAAIAALSIACAEFLALIVPGVGRHITATGIGITVLLFALNWIGVREGSLAQIVASAAKALLLLGLIFLIFAFRPPAEAVTAAAPAAAPIGFFALVVAYQLIIGAYNGWANTVYFAEEDRNPERNIPRALFGTIFAVMAIYLLMNGALLYALPVDRLSTAELPVAMAIEDIFGRSSVTVVAIIAVVTVVGCINASIMIASRIMHGLGRDGFLPAATAHVNRGGTPDVAMALAAVVAIALALSGEFETVFLVLAAFALFVLVLVDLAFFKLRFSEPELPRPYRAKFYPWLPALALLIDLAVLLAFLASDLRSALFMAMAVALCIPLSMIARRGRARLNNRAAADPR